MSESSLLFYVSCHQTYRISLALRDPVPFWTHHCYIYRYPEVGNRYFENSVTTAIAIC